jgi:hypothetical protein
MDDVPEGVRETEHFERAARLEGETIFRKDVLSMMARSLVGMWICALAALLVLSGCASGAYGNERGWSRGMGDLPSQIGSAGQAGEEGGLPGVGENAPFPNLWMNDRLPAETGFAAPTGKWFFENGQGRLGYGITGGVQRPGNELAVTLFGHGDGGVAMDRDVRIRLIARTRDLAEKSVMLDEIVHVGTVSGELRIYEGTVPEGDNALYTFSAEVLDERGNVEDARVTLIYVPEPAINASLATERPRYGKDDRLVRFTLANAGPTVLMLGAEFTVEKRVDDEWRVVPLDLAFPEIALYLLPGEADDRSFDASRLGPGTYRIIKAIRADGFDGLTAVLAAEFVLER